MSSVDERVVEMRFDNDQFERGVQQTISSLDRLKEGLKFNNIVNGFSGLANISQALNTKKIEKSISSLNNKFSAIGIAGQEVAKRVANSAITAVKKVTTALPAQIKNGGWTRASNLAQAQFQLKGLGVEWKDVGNDISYAVNQTSYGLDEAAKVAGQLAASGVKAGGAAITTAKDVSTLADKWDAVTGAQRKNAAQTAVQKKDLDQMSVALRAISGVASMTGASYSEIGQIFSRVAGQGRVYATDLNSLAVRGLNATAILGEQLGKSEDDIRKMTKSGKIDFEIFSNAMYNAFANQATKANDTFSGSLANMKAALSRIGADVADDVLPAGTKIFNSLRLLFNQVHTTIQPILDSMGKAVVAGGNTIAAIIDTVTGKMKDGGKAFETPVQVIAKAIDGITAGIEAVGKKFGVKEFVTNTKEIVAAFNELDKKTHTLANIRDGFANIGKVVANVATAIKGSIEWTIRDWSKDLGKVDASTLSKGFKDFTATLADSEFRMQRMRLIIGNFVNAIGMVIKPVISAVKTFGQALGETMSAAYKGGAWVAAISWRLRELGQAMVLSSDGTKGLKDVFTALLSPLRVIIPAFAKVIEWALQLGRVLAELNGKFLDWVGKSNVIGKAGDALTKFGDGVSKTFKKVRTAFKDGTVTKKITDTTGKIGKVLKDSGMLNRTSSGIKKLGSGLSTAFSSVKDWAKNSNFFQNIGKWLKSAAEGIGEFVVKLGNSEGFQKFTASAQRLLGVLGSGLLSGLESLGNVLGNVASKLGGVKFEGSGIDKLVQFFSTIGEKLSGAMDSVSNAIEGKNPFEVLGKWFSDFGKDLKENTVIGGIVDFFQKLDIGKALSGIFKSIQDALDGFKLGDSLEKLFKPIHDALFGVDVMAGELGEDTATKTVQKKGGGLGSALKSFGESIKSAVGGIDWGGIVDALQNGVGKVVDTVLKIFSDPRIQTIAKDLYAIVNAFQVLALLKNAGKMFKSFAGLGDSISGFFKSLSERIKGSEKAKSKLKDFTECVALLAGSIAALSFVKKYAGADNYGSAIKTVAGLIAGCAALLIAVGKVHVNTDNIDSFTKGMKNLGIGIAAMVGALAVMALIPADMYSSGIVRLAFMLGELAIAIGLMNKISGGKQVSKAPFISFAIAIGILVPILKLLSKMDDDSYKNGVIKLGIVMGILAGVIGGMNRLSGGNSVKFGTLIGFALSLLALMKVLGQLTALAQSDSANNYANLAAAAIAIAGIFIAFGGALRLASTNQHGTGEAVAFVADILAVTIALNSLVGTVQDAGSYVPLLAAASAIGAVFIAFGGALKLASDNGISGTGTAVAMIFDIIAVFAALKELSAQASDAQGIVSLAVAAGAMSLVMVAFGKAMQMASSQKADAGAILQMVATIGTVALSLAAIAQYPWEQIAAAGASLSICLIALSKAMTIMQGNQGMSAGGIITMVAAVASVAASLMLLAQIPFQKIIGAAAGMAAGFLALSVGIAALSAVSGNALGVFASLASLGAGLAVTAAGIAAFGAAVEIAAAGISTGVGMIANAIGSILSIIPGTKKIGAALKGVGDDINKFNAATVKGQFKAIGDGIGELKNGGDEADKAGDKVDKAGDKYQNGANKVEAGNKKMAESSKMASTEIDASTTAMANNAQKASDSGEGFVTAVDDSTSKVQTKLLDFKNMKLEDLVPDFGDGSDMLNKLGINLDSMAPQMQEQVKGLLGNLDLGDIGSAIGENGLDIHKLIPDDLWAQMPEEIQSQFNDMAGKIDFSSIGASMTGGEGGGIASDFVKQFLGGDQATEAAKEEASKVGPAYTQAISESMSQSSGAGDQMNTTILANLQQNNESFRQAGDTAGKAYAEGISNSAGTNLSGLTIVNQAINAVRTGTDVFRTEGMTAGQNYADGLGEGMNTAGLAVSTAVDQAVNLVRNLSSVFTSEGQTAGQNYAQGLSTGAQSAALTVSTMVNQAVNAVRSQATAFMSAGMACGQQFAQGLSQGGQNAGNAARTMAMNTRNALAQMAGVFRTTGVVVIQGFVAGIATGGATAAGAARSVSNQAASALRAGAGQAGAAARALMSQFQTGIYAGGSAAVAAAGSIANQAGAALANGSGYAYSSGVHLGQNFANGVRAGGAAAVAAAQSIAAQVAAVLKHSKPKKGPLKDDDVWGKHMAQNIAKGMEDGTPLVGKAASGMAGQAAKSIKKVANSVKFSKNNNNNWGKDLSNSFAKGIEANTGKVSAATKKMVAEANAAANSEKKKGEKDSKKTDKDVVSDAESSLSELKKIRDVSKKDEANYWNAIMQQVKKGSKQYKEAQKNMEEAIYESAEETLDDMKKQRGEDIEDEAEYWHHIISLVSKNAELKKKAVEKMNDAIISDTEHALSNLEKREGKYSAKNVEYWTNAYGTAKKLGANGATLIKIADNISASYSKDAEAIIDKNKILNGERWDYSGFAYETWTKTVKKMREVGANMDDIQDAEEKRRDAFKDMTTQWLDDLKEQAKIEGRQWTNADSERFFQERLENTEEQSGEMYEYLEQQRRDYHREAQNDLVSGAEDDLKMVQNFYDMSNIQQAEYWDNVAKKCDQGSEAARKAEQKALDARLAAWKEYKDAVDSTQKSLMNSLSMGTEFKFNDQKFDILGNEQNMLSGVEEYSSAVSDVVSRGILSQDTIDRLKDTFGVKDTWAWQMLKGYSDDQLQQIEDIEKALKEKTKDTAEKLNAELKPDFKYSDADLKTIKQSTDNVMNTITKSVRDSKAKENVAAYISETGDLGVKTGNEYEEQFYSVGLNLMSGMKNGVIREAPAVAQAMADAVQRAIDAAKSAAAVASPSKKTTKIGSFIGEGLYNGIESWADTLKNSGRHLGTTVLSGMSTAIDMINESFNSDPSLEPVIKPVVDMANAERASSAMDSMFSNSRAMEIGAMAANANSAFGLGATTSTTYSNKVGAINVSIYATDKQDPNEIADTVINKINRKLIRAGKV